MDNRVVNVAYYPSSNEYRIFHPDTPLANRLEGYNFLYVVRRKFQKIYVKLCRFRNPLLTFHQLKQPPVQKQTSCRPTTRRSTTQSMFHDPRTSGSCTARKKAEKYYVKGLVFPLEKSVSLLTMSHT